MKKKVYLIALLLSLAMTTILTSCSNNNPEKLIVGDWKLEKVSYQPSQYEIGYGFQAWEKDEDDFYEKHELKFTDDGRLFVNGKNNTNASYYVTENYITFISSGGALSGKDMHLGNGDWEYSLTRNRLTIYAMNSDGTWRYKHIFKRI